MMFYRKNILYVFYTVLSLLLILSFSQVNTEGLILTQETAQKNKILCYKKGKRGENILLIGCIHGNEKAGIPLSTKVFNEVCSKIYLRNTLIFIPTLNPDGNILNTRTNSNKVDINRNFPSRNWSKTDTSIIVPEKKTYWGGSSPASEIETRFILKIDSIYHPDVVIVLHQFMNCIEYDGRGFRVADYISTHTSQRLTSEIGYDTYGSIGSYFGDDKKKKVVTIEIPENPSPYLLYSIFDALVDVVATGY